MSDLIDRQAAIDALRKMQTYKLFSGDDMLLIDQAGAQTELMLLPPARPEQLGTNLAEVGTDLANKRVIDVEGLDEQIRCEMCVNPMHTDRGCDGNCRYNENLYKRIIQMLDERIKPLPSAQPEIIYCKDCVKHNKGVGDYEVHPDGSSTWIWKDSACPLVSWRDKAQGHEFDYQFCAYAERREVTT